MTRPGTWQSSLHRRCVDSRRSCPGSPKAIITIVIWSFQERAASFSLSYPHFQSTLPSAAALALRFLPSLALCSLQSEHERPSLGRKGVVAQSGPSKRQLATVHYSMLTRSNCMQIVFKFLQSICTKYCTTYHYSRLMSSGHRFCPACEAWDLPGIKEKGIFHLQHGHLQSVLVTRSRCGILHWHPPL